MRREEMIQAVMDHKLIAIMRGVEKGQAALVAEALFRGGIRCLEVTFNQRHGLHCSHTREIISDLNQRFGSRMHIGAGTVMSVEQVQAAYEGGASFILAPNVNRSVIEEAGRLQMASIPGALTPSEIADAYAYGASLVKLFPAGDMGISYCKSVMSPINHIPMIAVGGIDKENLSEYLQIGFTGVGISSGLIDKGMISKERYEELEILAKQFVKIAGEAG